MFCLVIEDYFVLAKAVLQSAPRCLAVRSEKSGSLLGEDWPSTPRAYIPHTMIGCPSYW